MIDCVVWFYRNLYFLSRIEMEYTVKTVFALLGCLSWCVPMVVSVETGCIGEFCFTLSNLIQSFDGAKSSCPNNASSSKLIAITDNDTHAAVRQFLSQSNVLSSDLIYIDAKLQYANKNTWYLVNGSNYSGGVGNQNRTLYRFYGYINHDANGSEVRCSRPDEKLYFICQLNTTACSNPSDDSVVILDGQQCFVKYETETVTWYEARKRCISNGGDLAMFNYPPQSTDRYYPPFNTSRLNLGLSYWVGIRYDNWSWISPSDGGSETLYDGWSMGKPNEVDSHCVCLDPNGSPKWSWTDCDCNTWRQFLCVKKVPITTYTTIPTTNATTTKETATKETATKETATKETATKETATKETATKETATNEAATNETATNETATKETATESTTTVASPTNISSQDLSDEQKKLIIGLVVGIGGCLLIIFIVVIIVIIIRCRKRKRDVNSERSSDRLEPKDAARDIDGEYAAVVANTPRQQNAESSSESHPEILYASFDHGQKPSSALNDSEENDGGKMVYKPGRNRTIYAPSADDDNDIYANADQ